MGRISTFSSQGFRVPINWCRRQARSTQNGLLSKCASLLFQWLYPKHSWVAQWVLFFSVVSSCVLGICTCQFWQWLLDYKTLKYTIVRMIHHLCQAWKSSSSLLASLGDSDSHSGLLHQSFISKWFKNPSYWFKERECDRVLGSNPLASLLSCQPQLSEVNWS